MNWRKLYPTEYTAWAAMKQRCNDKNCSSYYLYGGRGIRVCKRWNKFENFFTDMGLRPGPAERGPTSYSLDRKNNNVTARDLYCNPKETCQQN